MNSKKFNVFLIIINIILLGYLVFILFENNIINIDQNNLLSGEYVTYSNESIYKLYVSEDTNKSYIVETTSYNWVKNILEVEGIYESITYNEGNIYLDGDMPVVLIKDESGNAIGVEPTNVAIEQKDINYYNNVDSNEILFRSMGSDNYGYSIIINSLEKTINTNSCILTDILYINEIVE